MIKAVIFDFNQTLFDPQTGKLSPGAIGVLENLKRNSIKLGLISYGNEERIKQMNNLGILKLLDWYRVVWKKTEKEFKDFIDYFSFASTEVLVVGDRLDEEIQIANSLGMISVWYNPKNQSKSPTVKNIFEIKKLAEVLLLVK